LKVAELGDCIGGEHEDRLAVNRWG
jgi:hypothetical protein